MVLVFMVLGGMVLGGRARVKRTRRLPATHDALSTCPIDLDTSSDILFCRRIASIGDCMKRIALT